MSLDELSEFSRAALEGLRQPLEDGRIAIVRAHHSAIYPARFMLIGATNPCPCGYAGLGERCRCGEVDLARHHRKLSGPLLDRIDLLVRLEPDGARELGKPALTNSASARGQVLEARERQAARFAEEGASVNAQMDARLLRRHTSLLDDADEMLRAARERGMLSARGQHRVLRVARTSADLAGRDRIATSDVGAALALRADVVFSDVRAA